MQLTITNLIRRLIGMCGVFILVSVIIFSATNILPGNVAVLMLGEYATQEAIDALSEEMGLDKALPVQYWNWISRFIRGDFGESRSLNTEIAPLMVIRLKKSLVLAGFTGVIVYLGGMILGIFSGIRRESLLDKLLTGLTYLGLAIPPFVAASILLMLLGGIWGFPLLPTTGYVEISEGFLPWIKRLILPVVSASIGALAYMMRITRNSVIETLQEDYIRTARLKGLPEHTVILKHTLRNALIPTVTIMGLYVPWLIGGLVIIENIFAYPGIGRLLRNAISYRDIPLVQASAMVISVFTLLGNFAADIACVWLNPKLRE